MSNENLEEYPIHESLKVITGETVFKDNKWWEAVVTTESNFNGRTYRKVTWYRWNMKNGKWFRKEHKNINFMNNWEKARDIIQNQMENKDVV